MTTETCGTIMLPLSRELAANIIRTALDGTLGWCERIEVEPYPHVCFDDGDSGDLAEALLAHHCLIFTVSKEYDPDCPRHTLYHREVAPGISGYYLASGTVPLADLGTNPEAAEAILQHALFDEVRYE